MHFLTSLYDLSAWILPFIIVLSVLVFFHEWGHYVVARWNGVKIDVFSIGFGPEIFGWTDKHQTRWKFSLIPLGGYVQMFGDANEASQPNAEQFNKLDAVDQQKTLAGKSVGQRIAVSAAGPIFNIILSIILLTFVFIGLGQPDKAPIIGNIKEKGIAWTQGLQVNDKVLKVNNEPVPSFQILQHIIVKNPGLLLNFLIERNGQQYDYKIIPEKYIVSKDTTVGRIGIEPLLMKHSIFSGIKASIQTNWSMAKEMVGFLGSLLFFKEDPGKLGSVLSIAKMSKDSFEGGIFMLFSFMALLSLNLGILNLFPIPVLDGGHLLFYAIEAIRGKPLSQRTQEICYKIGFGLLISLMIYTFWNDLSRFKIVEFAKGIIGKLFA